MPVYRYEARDSFGSDISGTYEAFSEDEVRIYLKRNGLRPVSISKSWLRADLEIFSKGVDTGDLVVFTRMFASLQKAAVPLDRSLKVLHQQNDKKELKRAIQRIIVAVESGTPLAEAMRDQPSVFPPLYTNMIEAGEVSGSMDVLLERLADMLERNQEIKDKVKSAMTYPIILMVVATLAVAAILWFVLPQFVAVFEDAGVQLPLPTRISVAASTFLQTKWWALLAGIVASVLGFKHMGKVPGFTYFWHRMSLKIPILGDVLLKGALARFSRTLATVLSSGVNILDGLSLTSETTTNQVIIEAIEEAQAEISMGSEVAPPLQRSGYFPPLATSMIAIGEESGNMDEMLEKVADYYEDDVYRAVDNALKLIEPIMLVVMGGLVAMIMLSIYLPMFDMISAIGGS